MILTSRTLLRRLNKEDCQNLINLESDSLVVQFTSYRVPQSSSQTLERLNAHLLQQSSLEPFGRWLAVSGEKKECIGWFMLIPHNQSTLELGFMLNRRFWGQGYATEISKSLIEYAKGYHQIDRIIAQTDIENFASEKVLLKSGFILDGLIEKNGAHLKSFCISLV